MLITGPHVVTQNVCFSVIHPTKDKCHTQELIEADKQPRYLSSGVTKDTNCGLNDMPWLVQVKRGQRIDISLTDFSWQNQTGSCASRYGYMLDTQDDGIIHICGGGLRQRHLYLSTGSTLQVVLHEAALQQHRFLLGFKGNSCKYKIA